MDNLTLIIPAKMRKNLPSVLKELDKFNLKIFVILEKNGHRNHRGYPKFQLQINLSDTSWLWKCSN